jgi:hypothetical protein
MEVGEKIRTPFSTFQNTLQSVQNNNIFLKVIYFLDYLQLKKKRH